MSSEQGSKKEISHEEFVAMVEGSAPENIRQEQPHLALLADQLRHSVPAPMRFAACGLEEVPAHQAASKRPPDRRHTSRPR